MMIIIYPYKVVMYQRGCMHKQWFLVVNDYTDIPFPRFSSSCLQDCMHDDFTQQMLPEVIYMIKTVL